MPNPVQGAPPTAGELDASLAAAGGDVQAQKLALLDAKIKWLWAIVLSMDATDPAYDDLKSQLDEARNWYNAIENAGAPPDTTGDDDLLAAIRDLDTQTAQGAALNTLAASISKLAAAFKPA